MNTLLALHIPYLDEWAVIALIGLLLFGKRLPEVGRSLGKGIVEFKKGLKGIEEEVEAASASPGGATSTTTVRPVLAAPVQKFDTETGQPLAAAIPAGAKFDPYTGKPLTAEAVAQPQA